MAEHETQMPFIRNLASSDRKLRTSSLESLSSFLSSRSSISELDAQKLWKGLFYALWMTDRPLPQQRLATDLANLLFTLKPVCTIPWLRGFWAVVGAQWTGIDVYRLEKFLLLVRRVFASHVRLARERGWKDGDVEAIVAVLAEYPFDKEGDMRKVPVGIRLHAMDIWVDELEREEALKDPEAETFIKSLGEVVLALKTCPVKPVRARAVECYEDERLPWVQAASGDEQEDDDEWGGIED
ncbi:RRP1-like protein [Fusarium heterosporum]|uniref:RRP1-like protein n=1 Tax=Fusarium heterosporum TaxID=42747 RepID=A0A8H5TUQ1_FUSHE|nr:RRP1-like protein [Fusarium heterosporum]